jgi:rhamnogalacturonyl hydrolase YesR
VPVRGVLQPEFGELVASFDRVTGWTRKNKYRGYEPADGNSSVLYPLTLGRILPMRVLQQVVLRAPFNIRPLIGVRAHESAIGRGYLAWGYLARYRTTGDVQWRQEAVECLDWLIANRAGQYTEFCWGDPYDYATRSGRRPLGEPLLIWSALIGQAFLHAYEYLGEKRYFDIARSIGAWILNLPREQTARGVCLSYVTYRQSSIHNSNIMGAAFLARLGAITGEPEQRAVARQAAEYTCTRQRDDGAWFYAEETKYHWIDSFHTGYNLSAIRWYRDATGDHTFDDGLRKGTEFYFRHFFEPDGRAKYFHDTTYPVDIQCAAQAIDTLATLSDEEPECLPLAVRVADWTIRNMQAPDGHFYYRDLGWTKVRTPMLHWGQGTMVKALATLLTRVDGVGTKRGGQ